jgi:uncharacterized membrane protein YeiB
MTLAPAPSPRDSNAGGLRRLELIDALRGFALIGTLMVSLRLIPLADARTALLLALLFGAGTWGVLRQSVMHRRFWRRLLAASVAVVIAATMLRAQSVQLAHLENLADLAQGLSCVAAFVLLFQRAAWRRWLCKLAPMGRMVPTNILAQALLGLGVFDGLGLGPRLGLVEIALFSAAVLALQAMASCWWMGRFRVGPVKWAWRRVAEPATRQSAPCRGIKARLLKARQ